MHGTFFYSKIPFLYPGCIFVLFVSERPFIYFCNENRIGDCEFDILKIKLHHLCNKNTTVQI